MAPIPDKAHWLQTVIKKSPIVVFTKSTCPFCIGVKKTLTESRLNYRVIELDKRADGSQLQTLLKEKSGISTVPQVFSRGNFIGDSKTINSLKEQGKLQSSFKPSRDYDLVVIGGGSGGLAASKEAASFGAKVAVLDFVTPTIHGTKWGLGGTCVNVGCIPKKLMHFAAMHGEGIEESVNFGWSVEGGKAKHVWTDMVMKVQDHIHSLNFGYRVQLREKSIDYFNAVGQILDSHTVQVTKANNETTTISTENILLAVGERPRYPDIPGKEFAITSDDIFSLDYNPGKTLFIGASYVSLECAGFLRAFGNDTTVLVRSILLRGFDQEMANRIGSFMENHGVKFIYQCVPTQIEQLQPGKPGRYRVTAKYCDGTPYIDEFDTVVFAIGRDPCLDRETIEAVGVQLDKNKRVICSPDDRSTKNNIFAIGDVNAGKPQLTPVAIQAGKLLAQRLFTESTALMDYINVPTTVFTPIEYGACGLSEEDAIKLHGADNIEVYHSEFLPLEWSLKPDHNESGFLKLICNKSMDEKVIGFHYLGPNAGEVTQGFAVAMKAGAKKVDFDQTVGIHPTCAEAFTTLHVTKSSGKSPKVTAC